MRRALETAATQLLAATQLAGLRHEFPDDKARRTLEYRPRPRPGVSLAELPPAARKAAHRLLAHALSPYAFAQAMAIIGLEEVLDHSEGGLRGRHSGDFWVAVFGEPGDEPWAWRFEGHHLSVNVTVRNGQISATPLFLGANPAQVSVAGRPVSRPLGPEEDLARALLDAMGPSARAVAVIADTAPADIRSGPRASTESPLEPLGIPASKLVPSARALLDELVALYRGRLSAVPSIDVDELHFAWEGPIHPGARNYYRIQAHDLLIEYDNTSDDANHVHTVFRRPLSDFGDDPLAAHLR